MSETLQELRSRLRYIRDLVPVETKDLRLQIIAEEIRKAIEEADSLLSPPLSLPKPRQPPTRPACRVCGVMLSPLGVHRCLGRPRTRR